MRELNIDSLTNKLAIVADNFDSYYGEANKADCQLAFNRIFQILKKYEMPTSELQTIIDELELIVSEAFIAGQEEVLDE